MKNFAKLSVAIAALTISTATALAQSSPGLSYGQVPTPAQWNSYFSAKQDFLGFMPINGLALNGYVFCAFSSNCTASPTIPGSSITGVLTVPGIITPGVTAITGTCPNGDVIYNNSGLAGCVAAGGTGTVTSVIITVPSFLTAAGCTITTLGTCAITATTQLQNLFLASPNGSSGVPVMRAIAAGDIAGLSPTFVAANVSTLTASGTMSGSSLTVSGAVNGATMTASGAVAGANFSASPVSSSLGTGYTLTQSLAGSSSTDFYANPLTLTYGALNTAGFNNYGFGPKCLVTSASYSGQLFCGYTYLNVSTLGTPGFPNDQFIGHFNYAIGSANTSDSDPSIEGGNDNVQVTGTGWHFLVGREIDITATHSILDTKNGLRIVESVSDAFQGVNTDAAIWMGNQSGAVGWKNGVMFDATFQAPLATSGTFIKSVGAQTVTTGIDWASTTFSSNIILTSNFIVSAAGALTDTRELIQLSGGAYTTLSDLGAGSNAKNWQIGSVGGLFILQAVNDLNTSGNTAISCARIGFVPSSCTFSATILASGGLQTNVSANASVATVLGSVGPTGSHTAVQEWLQIEGTGGTIRYVPGF